MSRLRPIVIPCLSVFLGVALCSCVSDRWNRGGARPPVRPLSFQGSSQGDSDQRKEAPGRPAASEAHVYVHREFWKDPLEKTDPPLEKIFAGISFYPARQLGLFYTQTYNVDKNAPVHRQYGDTFLSFRSLGGLGWSFENLLEVMIEKDGKTFELRGRCLLTDIHVLENEGRRAVADFVFNLDDEGNFACLRCINYADKPDWLWCEVYLVGERYRLVSVGLSSFGGFAGTGYPFRTRWFAGPAKHLPMQETGVHLAPAEWPWVLIHHKRGYGNRGSIGVFNPDEIKAMTTRYLGYGVNLFPKDGCRAVRFGLASYARSDEAAIAGMKEQGPEYQEFVQALDWNVDFRAGLDFAERQKPLFGAGFLGTAQGAEFMVQYDRLLASVPAGSPGDRAAELRYGRQLTGLIRGLDVFARDAFRFLADQHANTEENP